MKIDIWRNHTFTYEDETREQRRVRKERRRDHRREGMTAQQPAGGDDDDSEGGSVQVAVVWKTERDFACSIDLGFY